MAAGAPGRSDPQWAHLSFDEALRTALADSGLSLSRVRSRLRAQGLSVGESTLSYWQRGLRLPNAGSAAVVSALEALLGAPPGVLADALDRQRRVGTGVRGQYSFRELRGEWGITPDELLTTFGAGTPDGPTPHPSLRHLLTHDQLRLDAEGRQVSSTTRDVVSAVRPGVRRRIVSFDTYDTADDPTSSIDDVRVRALEGCRLGRIARDRQAHLLMVELLFDRVLAVDDVHVIAHEVTTPRIRCPGTWRIIRSEAGPFLQQVQFDPACLPVRCVREVHVPGVPEPVESEELVIDRTSVASAWFPRRSPGRAGIRLEWTAPDG